jgi:hypothetical protein
VQRETQAGTPCRFAETKSGPGEPGPEGLETKPHSLLYLASSTKKKMLATNSVLNAEQLIVIDAAFHEETLRPGALHFLNTQKLAKDKGWSLLAITELSLYGT